MKKTFTIIVPILIVLIVGFVVNFTLTSKKVNLDFAKTITLNYKSEEKDIHINITDTDEFNQLISICKGTASNNHGIPSCGFGEIELIFEGNGKNIVIYPACDSCDTMRLGKQNKYYYLIGDDNRKSLVKILSKYGATTFMMQ